MTKEFIDQVCDKVKEITDDRAEFDDYTQVSISIQSAVRAAQCAIFNAGADSELYAKFMHDFIHLLALEEIDSLFKYDVVFTPRKNAVQK